jgi:hypothetical protein
MANQLVDKRLSAPIVLKRKEYEKLLKQYLKKQEKR